MRALPNEEAPLSSTRFAVLWNEIDPYWVDTMQTWELQLRRPGDVWAMFRTPLGELPDHADDFDAYVVTGSQHSVNDPEQAWVGPVQDFLRRAAAADRRVVGSCFGAQLIGSAFGGQVGPNPSGEYVLGLETVSPVVSTRLLPRASALSQSHGECVRVLPPGATWLGTSPTCRHEVFTVGPDVLALQAHPELSRREVRDRILRRRTADGRTTPTQAEHVLRTRESDSDGPAIMALLSAVLRRELSG